MAFRYCNHIKSDGIQCHSPAMRDKKFCHYHAQYRRRILPTKHTPGSIAIPMVDANRNLIHTEAPIDPIPGAGDPATPSTAGTYAQVPLEEQLASPPKSEVPPEQELTKEIRGGDPLRGRLQAERHSPSASRIGTVTGKPVARCT